MQPLFRLGLVEAAQKIATGEITSAELTRSCLARIAQLEDEVGAFAWLDGARAMDCAEAADARQRAGAPPGLLHGLPIGVKDIMPTRGIPTERGSPIFRGDMPTASADVVDKLEAAGAFVLGKTVTAEFAFLTPGKTRNPWSPLHTPGGSSSGSAAAVAAGFCPGALGTQTNGSMIRPAAFCGVVGYKPTHGFIRFDGVHHFSRTLDQIGVFARSVADCACLAAALADEPGTIPTAPASLDRLPKLAAVRTPVWDRATEAQQARFATDIAALRDAGALVWETELPPRFSAAHTAQRRIMYREGADEFAALVRTHGDDLSPGLRAALAEGAQLSDAELAEALAVRDELAQALDVFFEDFDAIITPPTTGEAPAGIETTGDPVFCTIWTLTQVPAISIPTGFGPSGLPLGLQITAARGRDGVALTVAAWCEARLPLTGLPR
jgi:Asp-tRNA(Asn)/Glu-tRNA(Gln) amidotransferase A subunit family amidase